MGILSSLKDAIFMDEDEDDDDELYEKEMKSLERKEASEKKRESSYVPKKKTNDYDDLGDDDLELSPGKAAQERRKKSTVEKFSSYTSSAITPPRSPESSYSQYKNPPKPVRRTQDASDISIYKVKDFSDAQIVCDSLSSGRAIIVSFEEISQEDSQRIMDFICGCIYVIDGNIHTISEKIYLFSPKDVDVSGDYMSMVQRNGFGVPTFNR